MYTYLKHYCEILKYGTEYPVLRTFYEDPAYAEAKRENLLLPVGKSEAGEHIFCDLTECGHLLAGGSTGTGTEIFRHTSVLGLIGNHSPAEVRLILIDLLAVEYVVYHGLPHLLTDVITDETRAIAALEWAASEAEKRKNLTVRDGLPAIVVCISELAPLTGKISQVSAIVCRIVRAGNVGVHLLIFTQRVCEETLPELLRKSFYTRIAFPVSMADASCLLLGEEGAEALERRMLLYRGGPVAETARLNVCFATSEECLAITKAAKACEKGSVSLAVEERITDYVKMLRDTEFDAEAADGTSTPPAAYIRALKIVVQLGQASVSLIQRKCCVGYNYAGKIIEWMEKMGYVSAFDGKAKARAVYLTQEQFDALYGGDV